LTPRWAPENKNKTKKQVPSMNIFSSLRVATPPVSFQRSSGSLARALIRQLDRLHAACVCQRHDGRLLCGLAVAGFVCLN